MISHSSGTIAIDRRIIVKNLGAKFYGSPYDVSKPLSLILFLRFNEKTVRSAQIRLKGWNYKK